MSDRAVLVGIDEYQGKPLGGAVNDALRMRAELMAVAPAVETALLLDKTATRQAILDQLAWLVSGATAGDRRFFFFSGHGMQLGTIDPAVERDGRDEAICPVDIHLQSGENAIRDKELRRIFAAIPSGVSFAWVSDSCCSADLTRGLGSTRITKALPSPRGTGRGAIVSGLARSAQGLQVAMISACASNGTAEEGDFEQGRSGALTQVLLEVLRQGDGLRVPLSEVVSRAAGRLAQRGYPQVPEIEGDPALAALPLWTF